MDAPPIEACRTDLREDARAVKGLRMANDADQDLELWLLLARTQRRVSRNLNRIVRMELGYSTAWIDVLMALAKPSESEDQMVSLADRLGVTPSRLTDLAAQLTDAGLVRRERNPGDRRRMLVAITPRGRRELRRAVPKYRAGMRKTGLGGLTVAEASTLRRLLEKVDG